MEIKYPIFLRDRDQYVYIFSSLSEINKELEIIDIEEEEYNGWDSEGKTLELYLDRKEIKIRVVSEGHQRGALKEAILNYAKIARPEIPFVYSGPEDDMVELFKSVEKHINR